MAHLDLALKKLQKGFQALPFLARKRAVKNPNVLNGKVAIASVVEVDYIHCRCSIKIDSCFINRSLTRISLFLLSELTSPFSFINPICRVTVERVQPTNKAICEWPNSKGRV